MILINKVIKHLGENHPREEAGFRKGYAGIEHFTKKKCNKSSKDQENEMNVVCK